MRSIRWGIVIDAVCEVFSKRPRLHGVAIRLVGVVGDVSFDATVKPTPVTCGVRRDFKL